MFLLVPLTQSEAKEVLSAVFKLTDYLNDLWNLFMVFSGVVVGWRLSTEAWGSKHKAVAVILYACFLAVNSMTLLYVYDLLEAAMADLRLTSAALDTTTPHIRAEMGRVAIPHPRVQLTIYWLGALTVVGTLLLPFETEWWRKAGVSVKDKTLAAPGALRERWAKWRGRVKNEGNMEGDGAGGK